VFSIVIETPNDVLGPNPTIGVWAQILLRRNEELVPIDRGGHPSLTAFFNADDAKEEYNARQPADDRAGYLELWSQVLQKLGGYSAEDATDALGVVLPDILRFDRSKVAAYPNGRTLTDDVFDARLALVSNGKIPGDSIGTHTDLLADFPYLETPPSHGAARALTPGPSRRSSRLWLVSGVRRRPSGWPHSRPERFRDQRSGLTGSLPTSTLRDKHATCSAT
jgi:hypothetical protein